MSVWCLRSGSLISIWPLSKVHSFPSSRMNETQWERDTHHKGITQGCLVAFISVIPMASERWLYQLSSLCPTSHLDIPFILTESQMISFPRPEIFFYGWLNRACTFIFKAWLLPFIWLVYIKDMMFFMLLWSWGRKLVDISPDYLVQFLTFFFFLFH